MGALLLVWGLILVIFYVIAWRPQQRMRRQHVDTIRALQVGQEIVTQGGIIGDITEIHDDVLFVSVQDDPPVEIRIVRSAVARVLTPEEASAVDVEHDDVPDTTVPTTVTLDKDGDLAGARSVER